MFQPKTPDQIEVKTGGHIIQAWGLGGSGKSTLAIMSGDVAPQLFYARFDTRDASHLLKDYNGSLLYEEYFPSQTTKGAALQQVRRFKDFLQFAAKEGEGVFVEDNAAAKWDLYKLAYLPDADKVAPKEFAIGNNQMREDYDVIEESKLWGVSTNPAVPKWGMVSNAAGTKSNLGDTGQVIPDGWKHLEYHYTASIYLFRTGKLSALPPVPVEVPIGGDFKAVVWESKLRPVVSGVMLDNPTLKSVIESVI